MRTKNAKRLWPVPATLAVVAVAGLLAFGLMATTGAQPAAAQDGPDCTFDISANPAGRMLLADGITVADGTTVVGNTADTAGSCFTTNETATVRIKGPSGSPGTEDKPITLHILYEDDDGNLEYYPDGTFYQVDASTMSTPTRSGGFYTERNDDDDTVSAKRYSAQAVEVPLAAVEGGKYVAQSVDVIVTGNLRIFDVDSFNSADGFGVDTECADVNDSGTLESNSPCVDDDDVPGDPENLRADDAADAIVNVTFLGAPSLTQDDIGLGTDTNIDSDNLGDKDPNGNSDTDPSSKLAAFNTMTPEVHDLVIEVLDSTIMADDFNDQLWVQALGPSDPVDEIPNAAATENLNRVFIIAEVRDADGELLAGRSNVDAAVTFDVTFHADSDLKSVARTSYSDTKEVNTSGRAYIELTGWNTDSDPNEVGPVNVIVTASYTGPSGDLDLGEVELARVGATTEMTVGTYVCVALGDDDKMKTNDGCPNATLPDNDETVEDTKPVEDMVFGQGEIIVVIAELMDMLGSETDDTPSISLSTDAKAALLPADDATGALKRYTIKDEAELGMYTDGITVSYGRGDDKLEQKLTFTISGAAENFSFDMPTMYIGLATGTSQTFTITGTDENGNVPSESAMVEVVVLGVASSYVSGIGSDNMLEIKDGSASFEIFTPVDAEEGDTALILVRVDGTEVARHAVIFGMAPTAPGMPMNVMAMATSHDMITVTWDAADDGGSDITGYVLQRKTGMMDFMTIAASSAEIWWDTLDCQMMNAEIPDDATPAPPEDDTDMTSPYCAMYAGLSAEATTVVDGVFADEYGTISGTSHSDMGLMAETTYYYRVSAINSVGKGEYSDGMAMAMTMAENMAPMAGDDVADQMVYVGAMVEVQSNFSDPDEDMLSYTATSDMMDVATATVDSAGMVTITGVAEGMATITVTASDPGELYAMQTIMVTVMTPNMAPMAGDDVADQMVYVGAMVEVQSNFSDPDEDMLSYTATSDMMDVATATVDSAGMVTITGVAEGMATITVTASDPMGESAMQTIMVTVMMMPPMELGAAMDLTATANDDGSITLMWTRGDNATHHFVSGNSAAVWEFAGGMSSHTVSIDKLVSGTEYTFYVISGRFMEADDGTWPGEWSSAGWTNAAKVTVQ